MFEMCPDYKHDLKLYKPLSESDTRLAIFSAIKSALFICPVTFYQLNPFSINNKIKMYAR